MPWFQVGAAVIGGIGGIFGASAEADAQNAAIEAKYKYDKQVWRFDWRESIRDWKHTNRGIQIQRDNYAQEAAWRDATAQQDWRYQLAIADAQDRMNAKAYQKSIETYGLQLQFNNMAAASAYASEQRKIQDAVTDIAFKNQDVTIQALEAAGNAQARGVSGRSAGKELYSIVAQAGRNQAILAESLSSAQGNFRQANDKIATDKYGADLNAWGNLMVKPEKSVRPEAPLATPIPTLQNARKPRKPPKPIKGAPASAMPGIINSVTGAIGGSLGAFAK